VRPDTGCFESVLGGCGAGIRTPISGKVSLVVDRRFELSEAAGAVRYLGHGHAREKIVVTV
jgi:Zinc-binding dehydrogenase